MCARFEGCVNLQEKNEDLQETQFRVSGVLTGVKCCLKHRAGDPKEDFLAR